MIAEFGHLALVLAFCLAIAQGTIPLLGAHRGWADYMRLADSLAYAQAALIGLGFLILTYCFVVSDFSVLLVVNHSHVDKPLLYKFSGVWGNHEGSMLLWVLILALFGALIAGLGRNLPLPLKARTLAIQGLVGAAFLAFILFTSNPFTRWPDGLPLEGLQQLAANNAILLDLSLDWIRNASRAELAAALAQANEALPAAPTGRDLNPILQDPGLAFHPPFLYLGYVGLSTSFSFAVAALIEGRVDAAWARWVRPWTLAAWMFLTLGIALGSWWAYYELGWGGWWFWDPVENASFMPWLAAAALFHSAIVVEKRGELKSWTILLAIVGFSLSLIGTFIVRSGVLTSVHAFASDPTRGVFVLAILMISVGGALALYAWRAEELASDGAFRPISREGALMLNNLLLGVSCVAVFAGTMAPLVYEAFGKTITVGPPFFDLVFGALMLPLLLALPLGAMLPWKRGDAAAVLRRLYVVLGVAIGVLALCWLMMRDVPIGGPIGAALAAWVVFGALYDPLDRAKIGRASPEETWRRLRSLPRSDWGKTLGHAGLGLIVFGIMLSSALQTEDIRLAKPGETYQTGGYTFRFVGVENVRGPNYDARVARVERLSGGQVVETLTPESRAFRTQVGQTTAEVGLSSGVLRDIYIVLGEPKQVGGVIESWALRSYVKPFVSWIWIGSLVMALGGLISLSDARHRVGAPAARRRAEAPSASPTPAE